MLTQCVGSTTDRKEGDTMAKNTGKGFRRGAVKERSQALNPKTKDYVERDSKTGRFTNVKSDGKPFKGVRKEK
jgi:hypothetical protein